MKSEGSLFVEEKDFIPTGSDKPKGRITVPLAFWPKGNEENRDRVLDNMMKEHPDSRIYKKLPKTCKYECSDCDNVFETECQGKWGAVCPGCFQDHTVLVG